MESVLLDTYEQLPFTVARGHDVWVYDTSGARYLDLYGGHAVSLLGHCPPEILTAIETQGRELFFYSNIAPIEIRERAAEAVAKLLPKELRHIFFCNSGAEANENALKLAVRLTGRQQFVSFKGAFHGRTLLATAVTDAPKTHAELKDWVGSRVLFLHPNDAAELSQITTDTAAVILEPIQSIAGIIEFTEDYLHALRKRCDEVGALLIFDEVQTGFGRTGVPFVSCGAVCPDMATTAKGIASGYPVGALFVHDDVAAKVKSGDLGSTYGAGPVAMSAVLSTVETIIRRNLLEHVQKLQHRFESLTAIAGVQEVRGKGCLIGIKTSMPTKELLEELLEKKIICGISKDPHVMRCLSPITITDEHIGLLESALRDILT